jgi:hypothetical protein
MYEVSACWYGVHILNSMVDTHRYAPLLMYLRYSLMERQGPMKGVDEVIRWVAISLHKGVQGHVPIARL